MQHLKSCVKGITYDLHLNKAEKNCSVCLHSKMIHIQDKELTLRATKCLKRVFSDI